MFLCITFIRQAILNSEDCFIRPASCFIRNGFASIRNVLIAFVRMNASKSLRMSYDHDTCLAINKNILRCLRKCCENNKNMLFYRILCYSHTVANILANVKHIYIRGQWRIYGEWAYECNSPPIRNDLKVIARHS